MLLSVTFLLLQLTLVLYVTFLLRQLTLLLSVTLLQQLTLCISL